MTSNLHIKSLLCVYLAFQFVFTTHADEHPAAPSSSLSSNTYGPIQRDCSHSRIVCIEGNESIFAVKGPLTKSQANLICPSTPRQTSFKRNRLPSNMLHPMIIVNVGSDIIEYNQYKNTIQKTSNETLPKFSYVLCGTSEHQANSGLHPNANKPIPLNTFLDSSFTIDRVKNPPSFNSFTAPNRKFAVREIALGDSLAYLETLLPSAEINYEIIGNHITGFYLNTKDQDITGRFDKEERLYEFTISMEKSDTSFSTALNTLVELYDKPVVKGGSSLEYDLDPINKVKSGTYIWKISDSGYLTISIEAKNNTFIKVKMVDLNQADKAAEYLNQVKRKT